jgi:hypothetical protein
LNIVKKLSKLEKIVKNLIFVALRKKQKKVKVQGRRRRIGRKIRRLLFPRPGADYVAPVNKKQRQTNFFLCWQMILQFM